MKVEANSMSGQRRMTVMQARRAEAPSPMRRATSQAGNTDEAISAQLNRWMALSLTTPFPIEKKGDSTNGYRIFFLFFSKPRNERPSPCQIERAMS